MNIKEFKVGDIVTRNEPSGGDSSYCGDRLTLRGHDENAKIIFLERTKEPWLDDILDISYARDKWDEGWCAFHEDMYQKIVKFAKKI
ncbi:MAG: hypothetical protein WC803_12820 [Sphingomonas sp.]|jgi:hypothetical protein